VLLRESGQVQRARVEQKLRELLGCVPLANERVREQRGTPGARVPRERSTNGEPPGRADLLAEPEQRGRARTLPSTARPVIFAIANT